MTNGRLITATLILLLAAGPALAAPFHHPHMLIAQRDHAGNGGISLNEAVMQARQQNKGKVLSAETIRIDGRNVHHITILTQDGRVKRSRIDARTGNSRSRGH